MESLTQKLEGPIYVLGGNGFIGSNLYSTLIAERADVVKVTRQNFSNVNLSEAKTVFNCMGSNGSQSWPILFYDNFTKLLVDVLPCLSKDCTFIHAGSSTEYGNKCAGPDEDSPLKPRTDYACSKACASNLIYTYGKMRGLKCANLRLYHVYGNGEPSSRLISTLIREGKDGKLPEFVSQNIAYDFIHVDDVCRAFILAALNVPDARWGEAFNIGTGKPTSMAEIATLSKKIFSIEGDPIFTRPANGFVAHDWYAGTFKSSMLLKFKAEIGLEQGIRKMAV